MISLQQKMMAVCIRLIRGGNGEKWQDFGHSIKAEMKGLPID